MSLLLQKVTPLAAGDYLEYALADSSESVAPDSVTVIVALRNDSDTAANSITVKLRANSNEADVFSGSIGAASTIYKRAIFLTAPGGAAWTDAIFDGATIRVGYTTDASPPIRVESIRVEATFPVATIVTGAATLTGAGSQSAAGVRTRLGVAALTGTGSLTSAGTRSRSGTAALTGTGSQTAAGDHTGVGAAALVGNGTLATDGTRTRFGLAALTGAGSQTAAGFATVSGAASLSGSGSSTTAGVTSKTGAAALTGAGSSTSAATVEYLAAAALSGTGTLTATAAGTSLAAGDYLEYALADSAETGAPDSVSVTVALRNDSGTTPNSITIKLRANGAESDVFSGSIDADTTIYKHALFLTAPGGAAWTDAIFDGATVRIGYTTDATPTIRVEALIVQATFPIAPTITGAAALTGTGSSSTTGEHTGVGSAALQGNGALTTDGTRIRFGVASLTGASTSTVAGVTSRIGAASLTGTGSLSAASLGTVAGAVAFTGLGTSTTAGIVTPAVVVPTDPLMRGAQIHGRRWRRRLPQEIVAEAHLTGVGWLEATGHVTHAPPTPERVLEQVGIDSRTLIDLSHEDDLIVALLLA